MLADKYEQLLSYVRKMNFCDRSYTNIAIACGEFEVKTPQGEKLIISDYSNTIDLFIRQYTTPKREDGSYTVLNIRPNGTFYNIYELDANDNIINYEQCEKLE